MVKSTLFDAVAATEAAERDHPACASVEGTRRAAIAMAVYLGASNAMMLESLGERASTLHDPALATPWCTLIEAALVLYLRGVQRQTKQC